MYLNNHCRLTGNMVRDPVLQYTGGNVPKVSFVLAVKREQPDASGEWKVDFIHFIAWRRQAEKVAARYHKGDLITVIGRLQTHSHIDENDRRQQRVEVVVSESKKELSPRYNGPSRDTDST